MVINIKKSFCSGLVLLVSMFITLNFLKTPKSGLGCFVILSFAVIQCALVVDNFYDVGYSLYLKKRKKG